LPRVSHRHVFFEELKRRNVVRVGIAYVVIAGSATRATTTIDQGAVQAPAIKSQSIAVLPFVNMSDDKDYFADGLSEELLNLLAKIPDLKVAGRTSSFAFKGRNEDLREIGEALNVEHVLEGSVRRSGDKLRVTAQLIQVADGFHMWSQTYDRQMADIFGIQDDVAGAIASELKLRLAPKAQQWTNDPDAYALYLQALALSFFTDNDGFTEAIAVLDRAIALDPGFAKAYELKATTYWLSGGWFLDASEAQQLVYDAAVKALELDPALVGARSLTLSASIDNWSWKSELEAIEQAARDLPDDLRILDALTYDLQVTGYFNESLTLAGRMIELDPLSVQGYARFGDALLSLGRREEARASYKKSGEFDRWYFGVSTVGMALVARDYEAAVVSLKAFQDLFFIGDNELESFVTRASDPGTGAAYLQARIEAARARGSIAEIVGEQIFLLLFGYLDEYWGEIERASAYSSGWSNADVLEHVCVMWVDSGCRQHPRYIAYAETSGLTDLWDKRGAPDHCAKVNDRWHCK
jgi:TolB-like protein/Flp pilus assembly protein TadD